MSLYKYLLLGGGVASHRAAEEIRKADPAATIAIISKEPHRLYSRVLLPHVLHGKVAQEKVFLVKPEWYAEKNINFIHAEAESVNPESREVTLSEGTLKEKSTIRFQKLLIATGGSARLPEIEGTKILPFRNLEDTEEILKTLETLKNLPVEKRIVGVYGAGFIAAEFINVFAALRCQIHIFFRSPKFWSRQLDAKSSALLEAKLESANCTLYPNATLEEINKLAPRFVCLGVGIGIQPSLEFLKATQIKTDRGILCNEFLQTNSEDIFVAGDIAEIQNPKTGRTNVVGTWLNAEVQGRTAGKNMSADAENAAGKRGLEKFSLITSYATKILDTHITLIGDVHPDSNDAVEVAEIPDPKTGNPGVVQKILRDNKLVGASLVGTAHGRMDLQNKIGE